MFIDGFVIPVKTARKEDYRDAARISAEVYCSHGATRVTENWGAQVPHGASTSFPRAIALAEDETVVLSFVEYPDRATRDACEAAIYDDPRMAAIVLDGIIDGKRLIYGTFETLVEHSVP